MGSISISGSDTNSYMDRQSDLYSTVNRGKVDDLMSHNSESSFVNQTGSLVSNLRSIGGNTLPSKPEAKRSILPNTESDKDAAIRKQSLAIASLVTNRLHPQSAFVTHGDWRRVMDGDTVLYYDPITNVISSTLPDGYPIETEEFLFDNFIHGNGKNYLNDTVCRMNRLFSKVREQLENRRQCGLGNEESSRSVSSNPKWRESDSLSQPSGISNRSEGSSAAHSTPLSSSRITKEEDGEIGFDRTEIKENALQFLNDLSQSGHTPTNKRRMNTLSEHFDRVGAPTPLLSRRSTVSGGGYEGPLSTLLELKSILFESNICIDLLIIR